MLRVPEQYIVSSKVVMPPYVPGKLHSALPDLTGDLREFSEEFMFVNFYWPMNVYPLRPSYILFAKISVTVQVSEPYSSIDFTVA